MIIKPLSGEGHTHALPPLLTVSCSKRNGGSEGTQKLRPLSPRGRTNIDIHLCCPVAMDIINAALVLKSDAPQNRGMMGRALSPVTKTWAWDGEGCGEPGGVASSARRAQLALPWRLCPSPWG